MRRFLAERYLPQSDQAAAGHGARRLEAAAAELSSEGTLVRHLRAIFVPEDETCFHVFEAVSPEAVGAAGRRADVTLGRIAAAVEIDPEESFSAPARPARRR